MAGFAVKVESVKINTHPNADRLEVAQIGDYFSVVLKDQFKSGDLVAYIPEQAVVPEALLIELGLQDRLAGKDKNRVKAMRLRGILSQGICYPAKKGWERGQDVTEELGVVKYEPPIPTHMSGALFAAGKDRCIGYDIENFKRYPEILKEGEQVAFTEKIHGTFTQIGLLPKTMAHQEHGRFIVASKGLADKGLAFLPDSEQNENNLYLRAARRLTKLLGALTNPSIENAPVSFWLSSGTPVFILGEVFGAGVQDLHYGANAGSNDTLGFRVFDVYLGIPGNGRYLGNQELTDFCEKMELERVPLLYLGPFSKPVMEQFTTGHETLSGEALHVREGIVICPVLERRDPLLGRVKLKSVSADYLLRKGGTEYA